MLSGIPEVAELALSGARPMVGGEAKALIPLPYYF
jgi:hypothetical protein